MTVQISEKELKSAAAGVGIDLIGVVPEYRLDPIEIERLRNWQESGFAGEMDYLLRNPEERGDPSRFVPGVSTILIFAIPYRALPKKPLPTGYGRVARYALGRDYHRAIKKRLQKLKTHISGTDRAVWRPISDSFPILERAYAQKSGLGFIGKNTMLIRKTMGSFFFLGEVLTDIKIVMEKPHLPVVRENCGTCNRCIRACPTGAFPSPHTLDARKCISYLTIEKRTQFSESESDALGEWLFGCDICQEVCPFNHTRLKADTESVWDVFEGTEDLLEITHLFSLQTENQFKEHFKGRAILRAGREGLLRNALAVLKNTSAESAFA
ncbi:MAG: tRNA epoxyqueuosine(34) reductase QueG, partial [Bdellovibrionota bacterium]